MGAFGEVFLAVRKGLKCALKELSMNKIRKLNKIQNVFRERDLYDKLSGHKNVVSYRGCFHTDENLYFVIGYCPYGSLEGLLKKFETLPADLTRFYAAQIVSVLEFMHS